VADDQEKTEDATPKKLEDARARGEVPQSKEFANFVVFLGFSLTLYFGGNFILRQITLLFENVLGMREGLMTSEREYWGFLSEQISVILWIIGPIFASVFIFGIFSYLGQFGFLFSTEKIQPKFEKINPMKGIKRIFSRDTAVEFVKSSAKVIILTFIFYIIFKSDIDRLMSSGTDELPSIFVYFIGLIIKMSFAVLVFLAVLGVLDLGYQRWSYYERLKMSFQEVKDEMKQREGDPHIKARIRQIQRELTRARMMKDVPKADVVVANPTHVAVALKYRRGQMGAPMVIAKGAGHIALKIKELAAMNGVPVLEKRELARYLYRNIEIGHYVPESLYTAVAEILAYVYRMKKKYRSLGGWTGDFQPQAEV